MTEVDVPASHPRSESLRRRHRIEAGVEAGITSRQGLIAQGRGEAFDYLLGERTIPSADAAERAAAAHLLRADHAVLSVNGNVAALAPAETVELADATGAALEVNLFDRTDERVAHIADHLRDHGAETVLGAGADVVLVPLEDGDRAEALAEMGTTQLVVDLNPLSRSARAATVPIVDNLVRALPNVTAHARELGDASDAELDGIVEDFDARDALDAAEAAIRSGDE